MISKFKAHQPASVCPEIADLAKREGWAFPIGLSTLPMALQMVSIGNSVAHERMCPAAPVDRQWGRELELDLHQLDGAKIRTWQMVHLHLVEDLDSLALQWHKRLQARLRNSSHRRHEQMEPCPRTTDNGAELRPEKIVASVHLSILVEALLSRKRMSLHQLSHR